MIHVETSQLSTTCSTWRGALRQYRQTLTNDKSQLQDAAASFEGRDQLRNLEQLHNQLHVQLINIHDLKQLIKQHERTIALDLSKRNGKIRRETLAVHDVLGADFQSLETTLMELESRLHRFLEPA